LIESGLDSTPCGVSLAETSRPCWSCSWFEPLARITSYSDMSVQLRGRPRAVPARAGVTNGWWDVGPW